MREEKTVKQKKPDLFLRLTVVQIVLCVIIIGITVASMKLDDGFFNSLKNDFTLLMSKDFDLTGSNPFQAQSTSAADGGGTTDLPVTEESTASSAGGLDITDPAEMKNVSFAFYEAGAAAMPVNGTVSSDFGERTHPIYGTEGFHAGRDIAAAEGSEIYAALDGAVIEAGVGEMSGNYVKIDHGNGLQTLYCHCLSLNVEKGVNVRKGDVIALVGQTGLATGPHLHFEVQINGVKSDPAYLLADACVVY